MKRLYKSAEPAALLTWKVGVDWRANPPAWNGMSGEANAAVRATTASDQHQLCCYCLGNIGNGAFHIEHFRPQSVYHDQRYAWPNLLASCESYQKDSFNGEPVETQLHCGHKKEDWFEEGVTTDPRSAGVDAKFRFPLSGKVAPSKSLEGDIYIGVQKTIDELNLNAPALVLRRKAILQKATTDARIQFRRDLAEVVVIFATFRIDPQHHPAPVS